MIYMHRKFCNFLRKTEVFSNRSKPQSQSAFTHWITNRKVSVQKGRLFYRTVTYDTMFFVKIYRIELLEPYHLAVWFLFRMILQLLVINLILHFSTRAMLPRQSPVLVMHYFQNQMYIALKHMYCRIIFLPRIYWNGLDLNSKASAAQLSTFMVLTKTINDML